MEHAHQPLTAHYECDQRFLDNLSPEEGQAFSIWFHELNRLNTNTRAFYAGQPLETATGIECWYSFFRNQLTPQEALDEDFSCAY